MSLAALLAACASAAFAQAPATYLPSFEPGAKSVALRLGTSQPTQTNSFAQAVRRGPALSAQYLYFPSDWVAFGADASYHAFGQNTLPDVNNSLDGRASRAAAAALLGLLRLNLMQETSWTPYILGGAGVNSFTQTIDPGLTPNLPGEQRSSTGLALAAAGGVEFFILRGISLSFEARYTAFRRPEGFGGPAEAISYLLGLGFWFNYD